MATYRQGDEAVTGYKLLEFLGRGSYGEVWKASGPGRIEVALKFISLDNKQGIKEFKAIGLVKKLRHPNIVPIHAIWLKDQNGNLLGDGIEGDSISINLMGSKDLVIAMGLGDKSLSQRLEECVKGTGMPVKELMRHMAEAAKGIDYLNEPIHPPGNSPIIHCDIKPANLLIVGGGVQVCDYGVARALSTDMRKTYGAGTPAYAAPELINNDPSPQTDQYSLAITYVEMRTGLLPFDEAKALVANLTGQLDLSRLDYEEREVIKKATSMQPNRRFATCEEFVDELKNAVGVHAGSRTGAVPMSGLHRPLPPSDVTTDYPSLPPLGVPPRQNPATQSNARMTPYPPQQSPAKASAVTGTVNFGEGTTAPLPPPPPANPWKTEPKSTTPAARESTSWKDTADEPKKGGTPIAAIAAGVVVLAAGAAGAFFLINQDKGANSASVASAGGSSTNPGSSGPGSAVPVVPVVPVPPPPPPNNNNGANTPPMQDRAKLEAALNDIQKLFAEGKVDDGLKAVSEYASGTAPDDLKAIAKTVQEAWILTKSEPADVNALLKLDVETTSAAAKLPASAKTAYQTLLRAKLAEWITKLAPNLDAKTPWDKLAVLCQNAIATPTVAAVSGECVAEIKLAGQSPKQPPVVVRPEHSPALSDSGFYAIATALNTFADGKKPEAAKVAMDALTKPGSELSAKWVQDNPRRTARFASIFDDAAQSLLKTGPANLLKPFTMEEAKDVSLWLKQAESLAPAKSAKRAHVNTLATWVSDAKDKNLGPLSDTALAGIDSLNLDAAAAARLRAIAAVRRPDTAEGRQQCIAAFKQILSTAREDAAALPKAFLAPMVLEPLSNPTFASSMAKADAVVKKDASALLLDTALDLRRNSTAWAEAKALPEPPLAAAGKLLASAVAIQPSARARAWQGLLKSELPKATAKDFAEDLKSARDLNPDDLAVKALDAVDRTLKLRPLTDTDRIAALESCDKVIQAALSVAESNRKVNPAADVDEICILYKLGADNLILLANADHRDPYKQAEQLNRSLTWANNLLRIQADSSEGFDALGCAREDVAWIVKPLDRFKQYEQAVTDFTNAAGPMSERRGPLVHRGRCRYKWAEAEFQVTKALNTDLLDKAAADFRLITGKPEGIDPHVVAEAHYWQAHVSMLKRIARVGDLKAEYATIVRSYTAVRAIGQKEKIAGLDEQAAKGLASAHLGEAYRLRTDPAVLDMARAEVRKLLAEPLPEIWKASIRQEERQTESYIDATKDNFAEFVAEVDKALADPCPAALRFLQSQLLYDRANAYSVYVHYKPNWNVEKAIQDCTTAIGIHTNCAGIDAGSRADMLAKRADLKYVPVSRDSAKLAELTDAYADLNQACALAPRHLRAWAWRFEATFISFSRMLALKDKDREFNEKQAEMLIAALGHYQEFLRTGGADSPLAGSMSSTFTKDVLDVSIKRLKETLEMTDASARLKLQAQLALREIEFQRQPPSGDDAKALADLLDRATREMIAEKDLVPKRDLDLQIERLKKYAPKS